MHVQLFADVCTARIIEGFGYEFLDANRAKKVSLNDNRELYSVDYKKDLNVKLSDYEENYRDSGRDQGGYYSGLAVLTAIISDSQTLAYEVLVERGWIPSEWMASKNHDTKTTLFHFPLQG